MACLTLTSILTFAAACQSPNAPAHDGQPDGMTRGGGDESGRDGVRNAPGVDESPVTPTRTWDPAKLRAEAVETIKKAIADQNGEAAKGHAKAHVDVGANQLDDDLDLDARNAMMNAVLYDQTGDASYAKAAATILKAWSDQGTTFSGQNGFLVAAWNVTAMVRAAQILKSRSAPGWTDVQARFEGWARDVAESQWLPASGKARKGTTPHLLESSGTGEWELRNVTNRTLTMIEATMHVARLVGDRAWFQRGVELYKRVAKVSLIDLSKEPDPANYQLLMNDNTQTYFIDTDGTNTDEARRDAKDKQRNDEWHPQAGLAAAVQICELAKSVKKPDGSAYEDLYALSNHILKTSVEHYAAEAVQSKKTYIPFFRAIVHQYGEHAMPSSVKLLAYREDGSHPIASKKGKSDPVFNFLCYNWGFYEYL
jgi:hypothetical protein